MKLPFSPNKKRRAFTLIEVLISTLLLSIVLTGLYSVLDTQRRSVKIIKNSLDRSLEQDRAIMVLYNDILKSDGNITIKKSERDTICINATQNSLYGLDVAKVCWLVLKDGDSLARIEGNGYKLPLGLEQNVEVDIVSKGVKLFDLYRDKNGNYLVVMQDTNKEPFSFLIQGKIAPPKPKPKKKKKPRRGRNRTKDNNKTEQNKTNPNSEEDLF